MLEVGGRQVAFLVDSCCTIFGGSLLYFLAFLLGAAFSVITSTSSSSATVAGRVLGLRFGWESESALRARWVEGLACCVGTRKQPEYLARDILI